MNMKRVWATGVILGGFACGGSSPSPNPVTPTPASTPAPDMATPTPTPTPTPMMVEVRITGFQFDPATVSVPVGGMVRWTNSSSTPHTVTSGAGSSAAANPGTLFDHNPLNPGETFDFTFTSTGVQPYFCRFHESMGMKGTVNVTP